jgi:5-methylcytosine-specific restriction protein A
MMTIHPQHARPEKFRNPAGVVLKLANFRAIDPNHEGTGMTSIAKMDQAVWDEFSGDSQAVHEAAKLIRRSHR